jgi:hypothetical protein
LDLSGRKWLEAGEDCILRSFITCTLDFDLGTRWRWIVSFMHRPLYSQRKSPRYPLGRRMGGTHSGNIVLEWGVRGFSSRRGLGIFLFTTASRTALGSTQPPIQWVPGALSLGVKRSGREADNSPPSSAEVKECAELYFHSPIRLHGVMLS